MSVHHHSETKVPGGKLVVADIDTEDGVVTEAVISGDFFLEPDEAYEAIGPALVGASTKEDTAALTARLDAALAAYPDLALHGFSTHDIAQTARRAIVDAVDFTDLTWEIVRPGVLPTAVNVALDEVLLNEVDSGQRGPVLRLWDWDDTATVIGSYQSYQNELEQSGVDKYDVQVVRRLSGGGAMFMEGGNCITYSIYAPNQLVAGLSYVDSYEYLDRWVIAALQSLGVRAWYVPINDITSDGGKIGGAAQKRKGHSVLHHVTMSYDIDADKMMEVLRIGKVKIVDKGIRSAKKRVDPLRRQTGATREEIITHLIDTFATRYGAQMSELTEAELDAARALVAEKYDTEAWRHRVP
ncbi:MAG: biotin/lipoate A/B protein ligase family protein [Corynebacterium sp.]|nr:biotin/lipoate A/B protein ligase family protein [Corynebacterium sp.]